jgi:antitoxin component of RelBE/YafQ-DinJ toxin-antitoxin module
MTTTTKTIGSRVNSEVHTLFTDVCNKEGITMSQKINQLVTDSVSFPSKTKNKVESNLLLSQVYEDIKLLDSMTREDLEKSLRTLDSKPRKTLDEKIRVLDSKNRNEKKVEPKFTPSKAELDEIIQSVSSNISKHIEQLNKQIQELTTKQNKKIVEDNMKKGICSFNERSAFQ